MTYGPVDFLALEFKGNKFKGEIMGALDELIRNKIVRIIDLVVVMKDANGIVTARELQQTNPEIVQMFNPLVTEINGMIQEEDIAAIGEQLGNNTTAALLLFENSWAVKFVEAVLNAEGRVVLQHRIPREDVEEALAKFAAEEQGAA